jgi:hypothetical protein
VRHEQLREFAAAVVQGDQQRAVPAVRARVGGAGIALQQGAQRIRIARFDRLDHRSRPVRRVRVHHPPPLIGLDLFSKAN